jgi:hypothetical protein
MKITEPLVEPIDLDRGLPGGVAGDFGGSGHSDDSVRRGEHRRAKCAVQRPRANSRSRRWL